MASNAEDFTKQFMSQMFGKDSGAPAPAPAPGIVLHKKNLVFLNMPTVVY